MGKLGPGDLAEIMKSLEVPADERVIVGMRTSEDAGVFALEGCEQVLVQTVDFITPVCDDPYWFGRVAAANSLSDIYAMGGKPITAMNICCFPAKGPSKEQYTSILRGGLEVVTEAGAALVGGQTVKDDDLKFLEFNSDSPAGVAWTDLHEEVFLELPHMKELSGATTLGGSDCQRIMLEAFLGAYKEFGLPDKPVAAVVDWRDVSTLREFYINQSYFEENGVEAVVAGCDFELDRCPMHYLTQPDPWRDRIRDLFEDYDSSNIVGWPDDYSAATVEAVRLLNRWQRQCHSELLER